MPNYDGSVKKIGDYVIGSARYDGYYHFQSVGTKIPVVNPLNNRKFFEDNNAIGGMASGRNFKPIKIVDLPNSNGCFFGYWYDNTWYYLPQNMIAVALCVYDESLISSRNPYGWTAYTVGYWEDLGEFDEPYFILNNELLQSTGEHEGRLIGHFNTYQRGVLEPYEVNTEYSNLWVNTDDYYYRAFTSAQFRKYVNGEFVPYDIDDIPNTPAESVPSEGEGDWDDSSDPIDIPELPSFDVSDTGLLTLWSPTMAQLQSLGGFLWSDNILQQLINSWVDPLEMLISLSMIPTNANVTGAGVVHLGQINTHVTANICDQFKQLDCGTLHVGNYYGGALDYEPYTKISIFLPFVGVIPLNSDDVMGSDLKVVYNIDFLTGEFTCVLHMTRDGLSSVLNHYNGNCAVNLPITRGSFGSILGAIATKAGAQLIAGATAGGAPLISSVATAVAGSVMGAKGSNGRSGNISANSGFLDNMKPYLIIERPIQSLANNYNKFVGYPSNITSTLGQLSGFTQIESVISNGLTCPQAEQDEIIRLLKEGVYL